MEPFYVGMGKNDRHLHHLEEAKKRYSRESNKHKLRRIRKILASGASPIIIKIQEEISLDEAIELEMFLINFIGRRDLNSGPLVNLTDGGEGGRNPSIETLEKRAKTNMVRFGSENPASTDICKEKTKKTNLERYGVECYSMTEAHKQASRERFNKRYDEGTHWIQINKKTISENTKKQVAEGRHPFQTTEYRERQRERCRKNNSEMNRIRREREIVRILTNLYKRHQLSQPRGGIWNKPDEWINSEIQRLTSNPFGDAY
jgi:hypothetical protein